VDQYREVMTPKATRTERRENAVKKSDGYQKRAPDVSAQNRNRDDKARRRGGKSGFGNK
jgi:hypothetical protein